MALPTKELDRLKPFKRINNEDFLVSAKPTDSGVECGCHTRKDLPDNLDPGLRDYLKRNNRSLGRLVAVMDAVKEVTDTIAKVINGLQTVINAVPFLRVIVSPILDIINIFNRVVKVIDDVLHEFVFRIGGELAQRGIRLTPQWVPVQKGTPKDRIVRDQIKEVEGIVTRSYGNPVEAPFAQWHTWMNWSIQVDPEPQYANLVLADIVLDAGSKATQGKGTPAPKIGSFDVQWDVGAIDGPQDGSTYAAGFEDTDMPNEDGPFTRDGNNWLWPATGMYFWASGRWVFDCDRVDDVTSPKPKTSALINPPRAVATAVWGAEVFNENPHDLENDRFRTSTPVIRFMFYACHRGGYIDYESETFTDDYEFIVDLPPPPPDLPPFPIELSPDIDHNTIVLRPRLLQRVDSLLFGVQNKIQPLVRMVPPDAPGKAPTQALVTIPADAIRATKNRAGGFVLSMGWADPMRIRTAQVKRCTVSLQSVQSFVDRDNSLAEFEARFGDVIDSLEDRIREQIENITILGYSVNSIPSHKTKPPPANVPDFVLTAGDKIHEGIDNAIKGALKKFREKVIELMGKFEDDECLFRIGVNGNWRSVYFPHMNKGDPQPFPGGPIRFVTDLGPDDSLFLTMGGVEFNAVGGMMRDKIADRTLMFKDEALDLNKICNATGEDLSDIAFEYALQTLIGNSERPLAFGSENNAMGLLEPNDPGDDPANSNPLAVGKLGEPTASLSRRVGFAHAVKPLYGVYETADRDYVLRYTLQVQDMLPKPPGGGS